jgi:hypothetical protein|tara:strand:- start:164 stop:706 length:543 start_codon:yes stop_codon:yes gene_type:complete
MTNKFIYTAQEYAAKHQITASALRKRRLSGKLDGLYEIRNKMYFYTDDGPNKDSFTGKIVSGATKKRRNVPRHLSRITSNSLQLANDLKQMFRINRKLKESEIEHITPDIIQVAKERHQQKILEKMKEPFLSNHDLMMQQQQKMVDKHLIEQDQRFEEENKNFSSPLEPKNDVNERDVYF